MYISKAMQLNLTMRLSPWWKDQHS